MDKKPKRKRKTLKTSRRKCKRKAFDLGLCKYFLDRKPEEKP